MFKDWEYIFSKEDYIDNSTKFDVLQDFDEVLFDYYYSELEYEDSEEEIEKHYDIVDEKIELYVQNITKKCQETSTEISSIITKL